MISKLVKRFLFPFNPSSLLVTYEGGRRNSSGVKGARGFMWKVDFTKVCDSLYCEFLWMSMSQRNFLE